MIQVKCWCQGEFYHKGDNLTNNNKLDHSQIFYIKYFKNYLIARIYAEYMRLFRCDYVEILDIE